ALQRREHHEQIGHAIAFVFVVVTRRLARLDGDRRARLDDELLRRFIEAYERALGIMRPLVDFQHVLHVGDKGRAGLGRDHPLLLEMGLENVYLSVRPPCCRWRSRRSATRRPSPPKDAGSIWRDPPGPARKPKRSAWLPRRRRKSVAGPNWECTCASRRLRSLPRQFAVASARSSRCWCPAPRRFGCRSIRRRPPTRPLSRECRLSSTNARRACPCGSTPRAEPVPPRSA